MIQSIEAMVLCIVLLINYEETDSYFNGMHFIHEMLWAIES
jgi:hypothetical protein